MHLFIDSDGNYPRFLGDLYLINPNWKDGDRLPNNWIAVTETPIPDLGSNEIFYEVSPTEIDGTFYQVWFTRSMTDEEVYQRDAPKLIRQRMLDSGFTNEEIAIVSRGSF